MASDRPVPFVGELRDDANYAAVARQAVPPLLSVFPTPAGDGRLDELASLLKAGLRYVESGEMAAIIRARLSMDRVDDGQRTYLLLAGMLLDPLGFEAELRQFLEQHCAPAQHAMAFLRQRGRDPDGDFDLPIEVIVLLIRQLGSFFGQEPLRSGPTWVTPEREAARFIEMLINGLAADPSEQAAAQIDALQKDPRLESWWPTLRYAGRAQRVAWREAAYRPPSPEQVQRTLTQGKPANAADLAELVGDALRQLAREIRDGNSDGYEQFWNQDRYGRPNEPRVEDTCRKTLLERVRDRLRVLDIDSQPEGHYADDKRADIRVSFGGAGGFNVPIEIKRDRHADLWRAMHTQLIAQYTRDPGAAGYGVYVVFWFGGDAMPARPDHGARPTTASELEDQLRTMLSAAEQRLIQVCVIDVAKPAAPAR